MESPAATTSGNVVTRGTWNAGDHDVMFEVHGPRLLSTRLRSANSPSSHLSASSQEGSCVNLKILHSFSTPAAGEKHFPAPTVRVGEVYFRKVPRRTACGLSSIEIGFESI